MYRPFGSYDGINGQRRGIYTIEIVPIELIQETDWKILDAYLN